MALKNFIRNLTDSVGLTYEEEEGLKNKKESKEEKKNKEELLVEQRKEIIVEQREEEKEVEEDLKEDFVPPFVDTRITDSMNENCNTVFVNPKSFAECRKIADYIKSDKIVTLNLENIEHKDAQRILDFLSGAITIKEAKWIPISKNVFTSVPKNVSFFYDGKSNPKSFFTR